VHYVTCRWTSGPLEQFSIFFFYFYPSASPFFIPVANKQTEPREYVTL
jgi:hypothetical protein